MYDLGCALGNLYCFLAMPITIQQLWQKMKPKHQMRDSLKTVKIYSLLFGHKLISLGAPKWVQKDKSHKEKQKTIITDTEPLDLKGKARIRFYTGQKPYVNLEGKVGHEKPRHAVKTEVACWPNFADPPPQHQIPIEVAA